MGKVMNSLWNTLCQADGLDPTQRMETRLAILKNVSALNCTIYRSDENDLDAEEEDLGDARIVFTGAFQPPIEWNEEACNSYFDGVESNLFFTALIECEADPESGHFFLPDVGDYVAVVTLTGLVEMYFLYDWNEDLRGRCCVLIRDEPEIEL